MNFTKDELDRMIQEAIARALPSAKVGADAGMVLTPIYPPLGAVPESARYLMARDFIIKCEFTAAQTVVTPTLDYGSEAAICYGMSAIARDPQNGGSLTLADFEYQAQSNSERYNSAPTLVGGIFGNGAGNMRLIGGRGWQFIPNLQIGITVTNLVPARASRLDLVYHSILLRA